MDGRVYDVCLSPQLQTAKVQRARQRAHLKTLIVRTYLWLVFLSFTGYSLYLTGSAVYNSARAWHALRGHTVAREAAWLGALTVMAKTPQTQRLEVLLVFLPSVLTGVLVWASMTVFFINVLTYKEEPELSLPDLLPNPEEWPTVDVMLPRYKEEWELFEPTLQAALALDYPPSKLSVHVCDDGARDPAFTFKPRIAALQESLPPGAPALRYATRPNGHHAKAGNLNNALQQARGQVVVVLDADMVAVPHFLLSVLPHLLVEAPPALGPQLNKPAAAAVMSAAAAGDAEAGGEADTTSAATATPVHMGMHTENATSKWSLKYFYNEDEWVVRLLGADNKSFYYLACPGFNGLGMAPCVGTGYAVRRDALDAVGGYVGGYAVEDVFTSLAMHKAGWTSKYLTARLANGLCPSTLSEHYQQRFRWCMGNAQITMYGGFYRNGNLSLLQKLAVLAGNWFNFTLTAIYVLLMARMACFLSFLHLAPAERLPPVLMLSQWSALFFMLALPCLGMVDKILDILGVFTLMPIYWMVTWQSVLGRLHPDCKKMPRIKASSEAHGSDNVPPMALYMLVGFCMVAVVCTLFVGLAKRGIMDQAVAQSIVATMLMVGLLVVVPTCCVLVHKAGAWTLRVARRVPGCIKFWVCHCGACLDREQLSEPGSVGGAAAMDAARDAPPAIDVSKLALKISGGGSIGELWLPIPHWVNPMFEADNRFIRSVNNVVSSVTNSLSGGSRNGGPERRSRNGGERRSGGGGGGSGSGGSGSGSGSSTHETIKLYHGVAGAELSSPRVAAGLRSPRFPAGLAGPIGSPRTASGAGARALHTALSLTRQMSASLSRQGSLARAANPLYTELTDHEA